MAHRDQTALLARLDELGELHRVQAEVDPELEIAAITERQSKLPGGGKALLFTRVKGSPFAAATNLFGSPRRLSLALGLPDLDCLSDRMERLLQAPELAPATQLLESPPCRQVQQPVPDLDRFPFLKSWPGDGGRFITLPQVFTRDPETGADNLGLYRVRLFDRASLGIRWKPGSGGFAHYRKYRALGQPMPVAIALGGAPALTLAAALPLPAPLDELSFAGYLAGEPVEMTPCLTSALAVPARSELVIEGYIEPGATRAEGPFGNHTGGYDPGEEVPLVTVTRVSHRAQPVLPATVVGPPPMEDCWLAKAAERLLLPVSRRQCPEIVDIVQPLEGIFHGCALVFIEKSEPGQGRRVLESLRREGWLKRSRLLVVLDAGSEEFSWGSAFWQALNGARFPEDLVTEAGFLGVDATGKLPGEGGGQWQPLKQDPEVSAQVARRWREYGFL